MYCYIYDEELQSKQYERELAAIENRLTDLEIQGSIARLAMFRDAGELIRDKVTKGAHTIIAVGNDKTLRRVMDATYDLDVTIGLIPVGKGQTIAGLLGIPSGVDACDVLSARITENIDLGELNGAPFLHQIEWELSSGAQIRCDRQFSAFVPRQGRVYMRNLSEGSEDGLSPSHPADGKLELIIETPEKKFLGRKSVHRSFIPFEYIEVRAEREQKLLVDSEAFSFQEFRVRVRPEALKLIVGKGRVFEAG